MRKLLLETPPDPTAARLDSASRRRGVPLEAIAASAGKLFRLVDLMTMSADDYLSEWFESDRDQGGARLLLRRSALSPGRSRRARPMSSCTTSWASMRARAAGASCAAAWARSRRRSPPPGARDGLEIRTEAEIVESRSTDGRGASASSPPTGDELRARQRSPATPTPSILSSSSSTPRASAGRFRARHRPLTGPSRPPSRSTSPCERAAAVHAASTRREGGFAYPTYAHIGPTSTISSAPMTTRSTAGTRRGRSSRRSCRPSSTTRIAPPGQARRPSVRRPCALHAERTATGSTSATSFVKNVLGVDGRVRAGLLRRHHRHAGPDCRPTSRAS